MSIIKKNTSEFDLDSGFYVNFVNLKSVEAEHTHNFIEIVYTLGGKGVHTVDGREFRVKGGDVLVINYHCKHTVTPVDNLCYFDVMVKPEYFSETLEGTEDLFLLLRLGDFCDLSSDIIKENLLLHFDVDEQRRVELLIDWIREEQGGDLPARDMVVRSALSMLLCSVFRKMSKEQKLEFSVNECLLRYFEANCRNRLLINEVAAKCGYTGEHFSRLFKKYTGVSPVVYLTDCRIKAAMEMLTKTDKPIETVMLECGFSNRTAFFKKFAERVGCTPLQFRKNQK